MGMYSCRDTCPFLFLLSQIFIIPEVFLNLKILEILLPDHIFFPISLLQVPRQDLILSFQVTDCVSLQKSQPLICQPFLLQQVLTFLPSLCQANTSWKNMILTQIKSGAQMNYLLNKATIYKGTTYVVWLRQVLKRVDSFDKLFPFSFISVSATSSYFNYLPSPKLLGLRVDPNITFAIA